MIAHSVHCTWWDDKSKVGSMDGTPTGRPCCPHCKSVLLEIDEDAWWADIDRFTDSSAAEPGAYRVFIEWQRGKCYPTLKKALEAWVVSRFVGGEK